MSDREQVAKRITAFSDRLVCLPLEANTQTESGIILPGAESTVPSLATVVSKGPKVLGLVKSGQTVIYQRYQGTTYTIDGVEVLVIREEFVDGALAEPMPDDEVSA